MKYLYETFIPASMQHAKDIVLTPDPANPNKFEDETNQLVNIIANENIISDQKVVLDFGCGMGRVSKQLIERFKCEVIGLDMSIDMLKLATMYVADSNKFVTCSSFIRKGVIDVCLAAYVLQHVEHPVKEIETIADAMRKDGYFILLNEAEGRLVPGDVRSDNSVIWFNDDFNVFKEVEKHFALVKSIPFSGKIDVKIYKKK
jgi:SAM-dependent methyltransferase